MVTAHGQQRRHYKERHVTNEGNKQGTLIIQKLLNHRHSNEILNKEQDVHCGSSCSSHDEQV